MKKFMLLFALASFAVTASAQTPGKLNWVKSTTGTWIGAENYYYKVNKTTKVVTVSKDNVTYAEAPNQTWQDKDGKFYKITENKLMKSDIGKIWSECPDWTWQGVDSKWYKFDATFNLMIKKFG